MVYSQRASRRTSVKESYINNPELFRNLVWDYKISPQEFFDILDNKRVLGNFNQDWAIGRVLENVNFYDASALVDRSLLKKNWDKVKRRIFNKEIVKGYDYLLQRKALSTTR